MASASSTVGVCTCTLSHGKRRRGVSFDSFIYGKLKELSTVHKLTVSELVNRACFEFLQRCLDGDYVHTLKVEAEAETLRREESGLRRDLELILRSGAYLQDYAEKLLEGDKAEVSKIKSRKGIYSHVEPKELDVILRILARREAIAKRLVELMDQTLPKERFNFSLTEHGWRINRKGGEKKA